MFITNKIEVIPFREFTSPPALSFSDYSEKPSKKVIPLQSSIYSFLPPITIKSLLPIADPMFALFLIGSSLVVVIALSESLFASSGFTEVSAGVSSFLKVALPIVGYGLIFWLFSTL